MPHTEAIVLVSPNPFRSEGGERLASYARRRQAFTWTLWTSLCAVTAYVQHRATAQLWREFRELGEILDSTPKQPLGSEDAREAGGSLADLVERLDLCSAAPFSQVYQSRGASRTTTQKNSCIVTPDSEKAS